MEFQDRHLICQDCGQDFTFTAGEQVFFFQRSFQHEPKRCKNCKAKRNQALGLKVRTRTETIAVCSQCGKSTTLPFKPTQGRPVFCRECFQQVQEKR